MAGTIRHKPELAPDAPEVVTSGWLPGGVVSIGLTAGASTPNVKIGQAIERILATRGLEPPVAALAAQEESAGSSPAA